MWHVRLCWLTLILSKHRSVQILEYMARVMPIDRNRGPIWLPVNSVVSSTMQK